MFTMVPSIRLVGLAELVGLGLPLLLRFGLVGLALWVVSRMTLNKYRYEYSTINSMFAKQFCIFEPNLGATYDVHLFRFIGKR